MTSVTVLAVCTLLLSLAAADSEGGRRLLAPGPSSSDGTNAECCAQLTAIKFQTSLPVVIVNTGGKNVTRDDQNATICTCSTGLEKGDVNMTAGFRVRGGTDSQLRNTIYQYAIDIDDKKWFLGMPKSRKWMLYAQDLDPFGLKNWFGFELARGTGEYTIRTQFCELFINDGNGPLNADNDYRGVYVAMEKPRQEDSRINIANNNGTGDISGGYLAVFKHGQNQDNDPTIKGGTTNLEWNVKYPSGKDIKPAQLNYLQTYLNNFETTLFSPSFTDPATGWRQYAKEAAWVDWFLSIELIRNVKHSYHSSAYIQKDANAKFAMGPVWDNVQAFGTCCGYPVNGYESAGQSPPNPASGGNGISSSGWLFSVCENGNCKVLDGYAPGYGISRWFQQLWKDPEWVQSNANRWRQLRAGNWSDSAITGKLSTLNPLLGTAATRTLNRWKAELYQPQYYSSPQQQFTSTVSSIQSWTLARLQWIDQAFKQAESPAVQGPYPSSFGASPGGQGSVSG